jgi:DNA-binding NtrC family response regulator
LEGRQTSLFHCLLTLAPTGWRLTDTGSATGTLLNGVQVRDASLASLESEIALGHCALQITPLASQRSRKLYDLDHFGELRGNSPAMRDVFSELARVAPSDVAVLVRGESGTGKELVAHEIVRHSARAHGPFITFDCSTCAPALSEGELFGYAGGPRRGALQAAAGGTVFLDEVAELPLATQQTLLQALETGQVCRPGEDEAQPVKTRRSR